MRQNIAERIPVTLVVGFLGSGKTTLVNRILATQHDQRIAVIVNEFGEVGIDGRLVVGVEENVVQLSNGCLCCTVRGDLVTTLHAEQTSTQAVEKNGTETTNGSASDFRSRTFVAFASR